MSDEKDSWLEGIGVDVSGILESVQDTASSFVDTVSSGVSSAYDSASNAASSMYDAAANTVETAVESVDQAVSGAIDSTTSAASGAVKKVTEKAGGAGQAVKKAVSGVVDSAASAAEGAADAASDAWNWGEEFAADAGDVVSDAASSVPEAAGDAWNWGKDFVENAADSASAVVDSVAETAGVAWDWGGDLVNKIEQAVADLDPSSLRNDSGPRRASYVANPDTPPSLIDPSPASAGDSTFVAGDVTKIHKQIGALYDAAKSLYATSAAFDKGAGGFLGVGKNDQMMVAAKNIQLAGDSVMKTAKAIDALDKQTNKDALEKGSKYLGYYKKLLEGMEALTAIRQLNVDTDKLKEKPSQQTVEAWADSVGDSFDKAGKCFGWVNLGEFGFIGEYYAGLMSAPKNYIAAFKSIMHARYAGIDLECGIDPDKRIARNGEKIEWKGELVGLYISAFFQPKHSNGMTLQDFMRKHQTIGGADLYKTPLGIGKSLLMTAIGEEVPDDSRTQDSTTSSTKTAWLNFVGNYFENR